MRIVSASAQHQHAMRYIWVTLTGHPLQLENEVQTLAFIQQSEARNPQQLLNGLSYRRNY
jgi:hypothetical protein